MSILEQGVDFNLKKGDTSPAIDHKITKGDTEEPVDLRNASTVSFQMATLNGETIVDSVASIKDAENGDVQYEWADGDTDSSGFYLAEWEVEFDDGKTLSAPNRGDIIVYIRNSI